MNGIGFDPALAVQEATRNDLVRRKLDMDALRRRLGDGSTREEKLRESCEGFEAIFLQKMWEQMRKTVPKEGYLHSKDEEMYQSLFDIELCKKMASAGGMGLADMLYAQLSQQLESSGRATTPSAYRMPLSIATPDDLLPTPPTPPSSPNSPGKTPAMAAEAKKMTAADLYSPLPKAENEEFDEKALEDSISAVQEESRADLLTSPAKPENQNGEVPAVAATPPVTPPGEAVREWAAAREEIAGGRMSPITATVSTGSAVPAHQAHRAHQAGQADRPAADQSLEDLATALLKGEEAPMAAGQVQEQTRAQAQTSPPAPSIEPWQKAPGTKRPANLQGMSRQSPGPVSATPKPAQLFGRDRNKPRPAPESTSVAEPRGMAPKGTMWPLEGEGGLVSRFGWQADAASGKRRWNAGIEIAASPQAPVRAVLPGTVVYSGPRDGLGHTVVIEHKDGYRSYYGHLEPNAVKVGDKIRHGAEFAKLAAQDSSSTNEEKTASLHFEFKKGEMAINPESAIRRADNRNS